MLQITDDLPILDARLDMLDLGDAEPALLAAMLHRLNFLKRQARAVEQKLNRLLLHEHKLHGDHILGRNMRLTVTRSKYYRCKKTSPVLDKLLEAASGDLERVSDMLVSQPYKGGSCREYLGEAEFDKWFDTAWRETPKPEIVDDTFVRVRQRQLTSSNDIEEIETIDP